MAEENYQQLINTSEFTRMWAEGYIPEDIRNCLKTDFMFLDANNNSISTLTEDDILEGIRYLEEKMRKHFLAIYEIED